MHHAFIFFQFVINFQVSTMALILNTFVNLAFTIFFSLHFLPNAANTATTTSPEFFTSVLNVTAALNQVRHFLTLKPSSHHQEEMQTTPSSSSSSSFSLQLHSRVSLFNPHPDYRSLVLARLERDSARVSWILSHFNNSELRPEDLSAPVISGEYFVRIGVGKPAQSFYTILDTGSDLNWIQCKPCIQCYKQTDPIFDPTRSSSYAPVPCGGAKQCQEFESAKCFANECHYDVTYGDGSYTIGILMTETVSFGSTGSVGRVTMGCGQVNDGTFGVAAGVLGLGRGPMSLPAQIKASSFSYCLVDRETKASSTLEFNSTRPGDSVTAPLLKNPNPKFRTFYYAGITGISIRGKTVPLPPSTFEIQPSGRGGIIVDTGTAITRLPPPAYAAVRDAFVAWTRDLPRAKPNPPMDTCYDLSSVEVVVTPAVRFELRGGGTWRLPQIGYMVQVDDKGTFCFAFAPLDAPVSILGNVQQQETRVSFDLVNSVIGFSTDKC